MKKIVKILLIIIIPYTIFGQTPCLDAVANATGLIGEFIPQCQEDGSYAPIQCWSSTGYCWCVDENGVEIPGTSLGPGEGIPNCECSDFSADISVMDVSSSGQYSCELIINVTAGDPPYFCSLGTEFLTLGDLPSEFTIPNLGGGLYNLTISDSYIFIFKRLTLLILGFVFAWRIPILIGRKTGGVNGDTCGASIVLTETVMLFIYAIVL